MATTMDNTFDNTATETIDLLEARLRRIEYALNGQTGQTGQAAATTPSPAAGEGSATAANDSSESVSKRLADLEQSLHQITSRSRVIQDLLTLHSRYPDLFQTIAAGEPPTTLDATSVLSIVLASSAAYATTASRLTAIVRDAPVPPADLSAQLIELVPRIARLEAVQAAQDAEVAALRARSAAAVRAWYADEVLRAGESWAELEGRVQGAEVRVRRAERARKVEEEMG